jgi:hypothetical protein
MALVIVFVTVVALVFAAAGDGQYVILHLTFALGCGYMAMALTSWNVASSNETTAGTIRIVNVFACFIIALIVLAVKRRQIQK